MAHKSIRSAIANCPRYNLCGSSEKREKINFFLFFPQLIISIQWKLLMNFEFIFSLVVGVSNCRQSSHGKEDVIYFNQFLPTSNFSHFNVRPYRVNSHTRYETDGYFLICIIIVPLINIPEKLMKISSSLLFLDLREATIYMLIFYFVLGSPK